jgi:hypothetical protein
VLACVVHVSPQGGDRWLIGCTFARELSDEDLAPFGARKVRATPPDQRDWVRYACDVQASYQPGDDTDASDRPAQVLNISASGVGLLVAEPIAVGTLLSVRLRSARGGADKTMLSCAVHVTQRGAEEWALGCTFISELSESELLALL